MLETAGDVHCLAATRLEAAAAPLMSGPATVQVSELSAELTQTALGLAAKAADACLQHGDRGGLARCALVQVWAVITS